VYFGQEAHFELKMNEGAETFAGTMSERVAAVRKEKIIFDEAFTLHHRTVFRVAYSVVRDVALAEDVTQEVFLRLYKNLDSIDNPEMLRPWLIRVALNVAKNALRTKIRANTHEEKYVKETEDSDIYSVELDFERHEEQDEVYRALNKVKEPLRSCLILRQQGLSYREIAESLSLNEKSIGQFIARGRKEFMRFYGKVGRKILR
jgi:RNA polymerase sigma-70 factor (ECF subfamily)